MSSVTSSMAVRPGQLTRDSNRDWIVSVVLDASLPYFVRIWLRSTSNLCSIRCSSCDVLAHMSMSSAKPRWLRYSPSIFKLLVSQVIFRNTFSSAVVNSLGDWYLRVVPLSGGWSCCFICGGGLSSSYWYRFRSGVRYTHHLPPVLEEREQRAAFALSRKFSRRL